MIPVLLVAWWAVWLCMGFVLTPAVMIALDIYSIKILCGYKEQISALQGKRALLLLADIPICIALFWLGVFFEGSGFPNIFFIVICPPALFLVNIRLYLRNACDRKMFAALIFTDPLLHYMSVFIGMVLAFDDRFGILHRISFIG